MSQGNSSRRKRKQMHVARDAPEGNVFSLGRTKEQPYLTVSANEYDGNSTDPEESDATSNRHPSMLRSDESFLVKQPTTRLTGMNKPRTRNNIPARNEERVHVAVVFLKIGEIDTVKETYTADVYIQATWREPLFDGQSNFDADAVNWNNYWNPRLNVDNIVGEPKETLWYSVSVGEDSRAFVTERRKIKGTFLENLELAHFPFDTQELKLVINSELSDKEVILEQDSFAMSTINVDSFVDKQEWELYRNVNVVVNGKTKSDCDKHDQPALSFVCHASRRFGFYVWNIMFVMFFITVMSLATFAVILQKPENRLQLTFILLLTTVTFMLAISNWLPRISYLTFLNYYILVSMSFMGLVCIWHAIAPTIDSYWADKGVVIGLAVLFVTINVSFFVAIYCCAVRKRNSFLKSEQLHQAARKGNSHLKSERQHQRQGKPKVKASDVKLSEVLTENRANPDMS